MKHFTVVYYRLTDYGPVVRFETHIKEIDAIMKKSIRYSLLLSMAVLLLSCSQEKAENEKILADINDYRLSLDEYQHRLAAELEMDEDYKLTKESKNAFLEEIIRKELLIQEAKRLQLDKREQFIRAIERYWESTLIRDLMEMKGNEIVRTILVSQEEVNARYTEMKKTGQDPPPLAEIEKEILRDLKEEKKTGRLKQWINDLREHAEIEIDRDLLYGE